jgi:hypothetical protein
MICTVIPARRNGIEKQTMKILNITLSPKTPGRMNRGASVNGIPKKNKNTPLIAEPNR